MLDNLYYAGLTVGVASGLYVALVAIGLTQAPPQVDSKGWSAVARGGCVLLAQACAVTAAAIVLTHMTPRGYFELLGMYGPPFMWGLYLSTAIIVASPLVTVAALWWVHKTRSFGWMSKDDVAHHLRRR